MRGLSLAAGSIARNPRLPRPLLARGIPRFLSRRNPSPEKCAPHRRAFIRSYMKIPAATAALRDSAPPRMGSFRR